MDEIFTRTDAAGTANSLADALGSTLALTNAAGTVATQYTYKPFGNTTVSGLPSANPYQYTGRENDGTGLYFYRARYYNPTLQRFISEDPIGILGKSVNVYTYARNNPVSYFDPLGLSATSGRKPLPCGPDGYRDAIAKDAALVLEEAQSYGGVPYDLLGPNSSYDGTDYSGLVYNAVRNSGVNPSIAYSQANGISGNSGYRALGPNEPRFPGDVVVFPNDSGNGHAGVYDPSNSPNYVYSATNSKGMRPGDTAWFPGGRQNAHFYRVRVPCD